MPAKMAPFSTIQNGLIIDLAEVRTDVHSHSLR